VASDTRLPSKNDSLNFGVSPELPADGHNCDDMITGLQKLQ
jgi:hypothetical protein